VLARIIEPTSKQDSLRMLEEAGVSPVSYPTLNRRLPACAQEEWRQRLSAACAAHARVGPTSLVPCDVSALYFEADQGGGFREHGFSKERRLEPQITIGLLTGQDGFPLMVSAFGQPGRDQDHAASSCQELWNIEKGFRMSKHDLTARPVYHLALGFQGLF
jgi:hypothetical protein